MPNRPRTARKSLLLETFGYFYVGGRIDPAVEGSPMTGQMYVEYFIPRQRQSPYPIVMVHGGSQTGTNFTGSGVSNASAGQTVASFPGSGTATGTQSYTLDNSWTYATGNYLATLTYTLSAP